MRIEIVRSPLPPGAVEQLAQDNHGVMVKGVADVERRLVALGGELHADAEAALLADGSAQRNLWGFNLYPDRARESRIEYHSLINIRVSQGNRSIDVQDPGLRELIREIVDALVP